MLYIKRNQYFIYKDAITNIAINIAKLITQGFTINEKHKVNSKIVFGSFTELNTKFIKII